MYSLVKRCYVQVLTGHEVKDRVIQDMDEYRNWVNFNAQGSVQSYVHLEIERDNL